MELPVIKEKVQIAIDCFESNDSDLLDFDRGDVPERPISHRLGFYMQFLFNGYDVDCEYNKHLEGKKEEGIPDILVHKRKTDKYNLLAVEVKAKRNLPEAKVDANDIQEDYCQLRDYTRDDGLGYTYGLFILVLREGGRVIEWFEHGTEMRPLAFVPKPTQ